MIFLIAGLLGLAAVLGFNVVTVLAGRWVAARCLGLAGQPFWPFPASRSGPPIGALPRALLVAAGFLAAYIVAASLYARVVHAHGITIDDPREISAFVEPLPGKAAVLAGMRSRDRVLTVAEEPIRTWEELRLAIKGHAGQTVAFGIERGGERISMTMTIPPDGRIGVTTVPETRPIGVGAALGIGFLAPVRSLGDVMKIATGDPSELSGPVGIVAKTSASERRPDGFVFLAMLNGTYGLLGALVFSILLGLRRAPRADRAAST